ncbi:MAG: MBL fold metallo-hydrolase [Gammaproteobacteria bacterium]|nr:MBL fold metallo-hydrolase [Gammaproteobacteria bacterium]
MPAGLRQYSHGISAIDTGFVRPLFDASHLIVRGGRAAFVDTGTNYSVPALLDALVELGLSAEDVEYIFLTHIHLDHAGGAGALLAELPRARVVVHPRGAPHIVDPAKLVAGTKAVYGDSLFRKLYGEILPIAAERVITVQDGDSVKLGFSTLEFIHTPGHALHHYCIVDRASNTVFAGDTFGVSYRTFDTHNGEFIFPATTPVHFDPDAAHASIERIISYRPDAVYLTHYSRVTALERLAEDLHGDLVAFVEIAKRCAREHDRISEMKSMMRAYLGARLDEHGFPDDEVLRDEWLEIDVDLNAKGLDVWLSRNC